MATEIVGLIGRKQSGKDTFAQRLVEEHGFTRLAFADPLKDLARALNPSLALDEAWPNEFVPLNDVLSLYGWDEAKQAFPVVRNYLQNLGVSVREYVGTDTWIQALARRAFQIHGPVCVTDVRFPNEAKWIDGQGGHTVRIKRKEADAVIDPHESEHALDLWITGHIVYNDRTITDLHRTVDSFVRHTFASTALAI